MKIVVDSNIIFSAILNTNSQIGILMIDGSRYFDFYSIGLLKDEIYEHKRKILQITNFSEAEWISTTNLLFGKINFVDDILLSDKILIDANKLVEDTDEDDTLFVALTDFLHAKLWTGDKKLINGLAVKGYTNTLTTKELHNNYLQLKFKKS